MTSLASSSGGVADGLDGALDASALDGRAPGTKRHRSWEVDVSLDELVEWDALEQFMADIPAADGAESSAGGGTGGRRRRPSHDELGGMPMGGPQAHSGSSV